MKIAVVIPALDEAARIGEAVQSAIRGSSRGHAGDPGDPGRADPGPLDEGRGAGSSASGRSDRAGERRPLPSQVTGVEVIVVDGGSRDGTAECAAAAGARVLTSERGRALQLGVGARACDADVVLFLHADTRLPRGYDRAVAASLRDPRTVGGAFRFCFDRRTPVLRLIEWGTRLRVWLFRLPYGDQAIFVRRPVLEALGGVPQVPIMEDLDLVRAMRRRGRVARVPLDAPTSARRYEANGPLRTVLWHWVAAAAWAAGVDRRRIAEWSGR